MHEADFVLDNYQRWEQFDEELNSGAKGNSANDLSDLYISVCDDLAFANSRFPRGKSVRFLNQLAAKAHMTIYRQQSNSWKSMWLFFSNEVPLAMYSIRQHIKWTGIAFCTIVAVVFLLALIDHQVMSDVIGDEYVSMTRENIRKGDPFGVYGSDDSDSMFLKIFLNNALVLLRTIVSGLVLVIGPLYFLLHNSAMIGAFHGIFVESGKVLESLAVIYIHGAFEMTAFVVGIACAFSIGEAVLAPGTYRRIDRFGAACMNASRIVVGLLPFILVAALLESYVTRLYQVSMIVNVGIVLATGGFIWVYVWHLPKLIVERMVKKHLVVRIEKF